MSLAEGTRLGPYEITAAIGAGGMGEVYRARDTRLDRTVAVKLLPRTLAHDARLRERFDREARAISSLSHPHICTLYDVGSHDGHDYLVMEFLEGESLADRLLRGPLPSEQVLRYGTQIAEALDKAHRAGIVHRDLKPGNVVITKSGAKLLDFGLAKYAEPAVGGRSTPDHPTAVLTQQKSLTEEGTIVGTFQYMAPEQIEGRDADARTDIFALGAVLYEMATGKRAFEAKTKASLIASILDREPPPISALQPLTPLALERVVRLCLMKDPDARWQSAHDVAAELRWIAETSSATIGPGAQRKRRNVWLRNAALIAAGAILGVTGTWLALRDTSPPRPIARLSINTPADAPLWMTYGSMAISPDGSRVVYRSRGADGTHRLYSRSIGSGAITLLPGTEGAHAPAFSPDGRWIAFMTDDALKKAPLDGGTPVKLAPSEEGGLGIHWYGNDLYYSTSFNDGIWTVSENGGTPRQLARVDSAKGARAVVWPHVLPGGEQLLVTVWNAGPWEESKIAAVSLADGSMRTVIDGGSRAVYSSTGHLIFSRGTNIMAVPFDPESLETRGAPVSVLAGVAFDTTNGEPQFAIAANGDVIYATGGMVEQRNALQWVDRTGKATEVVPTRRPYGSLSVSPDRRFIAVTLETALFDVWLLDVERDAMTRLSFGGDDLTPLFSLDGRYVYWSSSRGGAYNIFRAAADGSSGEERITSSPRSQFAFAMTPDSRSLIYSEIAGPGNMDVFLLPLDTRKPKLLLGSEHNEIGMDVSPDGKWFLYESNESGTREIYMRPFEGGGARWQVSVGGSRGGGFVNGGREVIYRNRDQFMSVQLEFEPQVRIGKARVLFSGEYNENGAAALPNGSLLLTKAGPPPTSHQLQMVMNFGEELKRRVPAR